MLLENCKTFGCFVDSHNGIYTYQTFAERLKDELSKIMDSDDLQVLLNGVDDPFYLEVACYLLPLEINGNTYFELDGDIDVLTTEEYNQVDWSEVY